MRLLRRIIVTRWSLALLGAMLDALFAARVLRRYTRTIRR
jgi:hypothetical protein